MIAERSVHPFKPHLMVMSILKEVRHSMVAKMVPVFKETGLEHAEVMDTGQAQNHGANVSCNYKPIRVICENIGSL